jgi:hypothetical protein
LVALVLFYGLTRYDESSLRSNYNFGITLTTDSKLENPTFIVPIPVRNEDLVDMAINSTQKSDGWNLSIIETEYGKMLKISAREFDPEVQKMVELQPGSDIPTGKSFSFTRGYKDISVSVAADHIIDTLNATENEPLLSQKFNLTTSQYSEPIPSNVVSPKKLNYDSLIYADYISSPNATVEVFVVLSGSNEWWQGDSAFNIYHERLGTTFKGEKHGWFSVTGELVEGEGFKFPGPFQSPRSPSNTTHP